MQIVSCMDTKHETHQKFNIFTQKYLKLWENWLPKNEELDLCVWIFYEHDSERHT